VPAAICGDDRLLNAARKYLFEYIRRRPEPQFREGDFQKNGYALATLRA